MTETYKYGLHDKAEKYESHIRLEIKQKKLLKNKKK